MNFKPLKLLSKYIVLRTDEDIILTCELAGRTTARIDPARSMAVRNHSPTGFNFGYSGSGPAQLALAILLDLTDDEEMALRWYQDFKSTFVASWQEDSAEIGGKQIADWLTTREAARSAIVVGGG